MTDKNAPLIIAIDGPAASGKSTVAKALAARLGAVYINTGAMYRALTFHVLRTGIDPETEPDKVFPCLQDSSLEYHVDGGIADLVLGNERVPNAELRSAEVTAKVSYVSRIAEVRAWLVDQQRRAAELGRIVVEGRDIGSVIFPDASYKFFLTASPEERARRRLAQTGETHDGATLASVAAEIAERDRIDMTRKVAPLKPADDAVIIDSSDESIDAVVERVLAMIDDGCLKNCD